MSFNFKVAYLGNGEIQIYSYPNYITSSQENYADEIYKELTTLHSKSDKPASITRKAFPDLTDEQKSFFNIRRSSRRSKDHIYKLALCNHWDYFCTFTFDSANFRYDYSTCISRFRKWCNNFKSRSCPDLIYLFIVEPHKDGAYHLHGLMSGSNLSDLLLPRVSRSGAFFFPSYKFGISDIEPVKDSARVSNYITGYIQKDQLAHLQGRHRYFCSKGLKHPDFVTFDLPKMNIVDFVNTYFPDFDLSHSYCGSNNVCYLSLRKNDSSGE